MRYANIRLNILCIIHIHVTAKVSKYGVISGSCFPNAGKYGPEITPYLDTFHAVCILENI